MVYLGPLSPMLPEFPRIAEVTNQITGESVKFDPPFEIHRDDLDWAIALIQKGFELDWEIEQAARALAVCCVCGSPDVVYRNYLDQPFCCGCAACCTP